MDKKGGRKGRLRMEVWIGDGMGEARIVWVARIVECWWCQCMR